MDIKELSKPLDIKEIDFRVQSCNNGGYVTILAYKDARVDMNRLDTVCSPAKWQRDHKEIKGVVYCGIGILIDDQWIWKWDAGAESFSDKEKGEASDSFKRAGFNWGIGRELYDYPVIQIKLDIDEKTEYQGKVKPSFNFKLKEWVWYVEQNEKNEVTYLGAKDQNGKVRYQFGKLKQNGSS